MVLSNVVDLLPGLKILNDDIGISSPENGASNTSSKHMYTNEGIDIFTIIIGDQHFFLQN